MTPAPGAATYRGADATFLRRDGWSVLLDAPPGHPLVLRCWELLGATDDVDQVRALLAAPPGGLGFAVLRETGAARVLAAGAVTVVLDADGTRETWSAGAGTDRPLDGAATVTVTTDRGRLGGPALPLTGGVVSASGFNVVVGADSLGTAPASGPTGLTLVPALGDEPAEPVEPGGPDEPSGADETSGPDETVAVRVLPAWRAGSSQDTLPTSFTGGPGVEASAPGGRGRGSRTPETYEPPRVLAARCPVGHLTAAYADACRVCGRAVETQELVETPRPVLGRLVLPGGRSLPLDRGAVLGRAPYVPPDWVGPPPRLGEVADPDQDVSAQHLAVVLDLWHVLVHDLGSTNGTRLLDPDGRVTTLRPHQPALLRPGGAVVLADVVTVAFEALP